MICERYTRKLPRIDRELIKSKLWDYFTGKDMPYQRVAHGKG